MTKDSLDLFNRYTKQWFQQSMGEATQVQKEAWPVIASGKDTLVSAPTGTGKTLTAFLIFIDRLKAMARAGTLKQELQLIYISPLKSLAGDIRENLRRPLNGILQEEYKDNKNSHSTPFDLNIAIRTGDTTQAERRSMIKTPPHILITTPESLYLLLTSKSGKKMLCTASAIIIDELHAIIDTKRGAHLMLSVARLDRLCPKPLQRIGLSATIEPLQVAAEYLSPEPAVIIAPNMHKKVKILVTSPIADKTNRKKNYIWQELADSVYEQCKGYSSNIVFCEGRMYAERLAYYINELGGKDYARTHHGSMSKEQRFKVEDSLRNGELKILCATSSMELGIDVGDIEQVLQIGCPASISSTMQRLGRAGHNPGQTSVMHMYPRTAIEELYCGLTAEVARNGGVEYSKPPKLCFDILSQHLVSMATGDGYDLDDVMELLQRAFPFREVSRKDIHEILCMLAGDYEHTKDLPVRPRVLYDRIHGTVEGDNYSRMLATMSGGTIPDKGMYAVKTENGVKIGELDEEYVYESHIGDKFLLGTFAWKITKVQKDSVIVTGAATGSARPPFWKGEKVGRKLKTGIAFGELLRKIADESTDDKMYQELSKLGLDEPAAKSAGDLLKRQIESNGVLADDRTIVVEHFCDDTGSNQIMVHSIFGQQVNAPLAILACELAKQQIHTNISYFTDDEGFLLFPYAECELPEGLLQGILPEQARPVLEAILPSTTQYNMTFRYNAARALMMGVKKSGRQPLWIQRLRSVQMLDSVVSEDNHPLVRETARECLEDYWDLQGVEDILNGIQSGAIQVYEVHLEEPSPMSMPLRKQTEDAMMYEYSPTTLGINHTAGEALKQINMISPAPEQLAKAVERKQLPENEARLHSLLMIEGDLIAGELDVPIDWFETLIAKEQVSYIEPGLWIAAEQTEQYENALIHENQEERMHIVRRLLRYRGAFNAAEIAERYLWTESESQDILSELCSQKSIVEHDGLYYHGDLYSRAQHETIKNRRSQIKTMPSETYAALLACRVQKQAPPMEQLEMVLKLFCDHALPMELWEKVMLPARVKGYRPELLDKLLAKGDYFWHITDGKNLCFHRYEQIDWDKEQLYEQGAMEGDEAILYEALQKRGASFMQSLSGLLTGSSPHEPLLRLVEKGMVFADSFLPVRQILNKAKMKKSTVRQKVNFRLMGQTSGRFEVYHPLADNTVEQKLEQLFDRVTILCRETIQEIPWVTVLETLRVWEYTGRVRRGYFIEGLSGVQFIRDKDFTSTMLTLNHAHKQIIWLSAVDTAQVWGKYFPHLEERSFINVIGTAVALREGVPAAVFERQGKVLRVFEEDVITEALLTFSKEFAAGRLFPDSKRLVVKEYPKEAAEAFKKAGFIHEMLDYVLYR